MKILITGTAGFIGFHLAKKLLEEGYIVVGLDNINDYYDVELKYARLEKLGIKKEHLKDNHILQSTTFKNLNFVKMDISDREQIEILFKNEKFDLVCNLAGQAGVRYSLENPYAYLKSNIDGFMNILEGCRKNSIKNLVYASSSSVYGSNKDELFQESDKTESPISLYATTKKTNELMAHTYSHLYNMSTIGLRFFTVYGPWGRPDMAPMLFSEAILKEDEINIFNYGNMSRDFTYIDDIVHGITKVIESKRLKAEEEKGEYKIYNIGSSSPSNLLNFIEILEKNLNKKAKKKMLPLQDGDVVSTFADISQMKKDFNYKIDTSLDEGIESFIKWYINFYNIT